VKPLVLIVLVACVLAGCASYTERTVVQKPVPAQSTVYTTAPAPATTTTTTLSVN
jgi:PBP1b-binding outer membrane lipoprotein LpoB